MSVRSRRPGFVGCSSLTHSASPIALVRAVCLADPNFGIVTRTTTYVRGDRSGVGGRGHATLPVALCAVANPRPRPYIDDGARGRPDAHRVRFRPSV